MKSVLEILLRPIRRRFAVLGLLGALVVTLTWWLIVAHGVWLAVEWVSAGRFDSDCRVRALAQNVRSIERPGLGHSFSIMHPTKKIIANSHAKRINEEVRLIRQPALRLDIVL
jgi:hypothetical protein